MPRSRTPAAPREPDPNGSSVLTSSTLTLWSTALISLTRLNRFGKVRPPCGLRHSLCTLHLFRFACLHQPVKTGVQSTTPTEALHSIRAAGQALPGRDLHPARSTKLCLAHQLSGICAVAVVSQSILRPYAFCQDKYLYTIKTAIAYMPS